MKQTFDIFDQMDLICAVRSVIRDKKHLLDSIDGGNSQALVEALTGEITRLEDIQKRLEAAHDRIFENAGARTSIIFKL